YSLVEADSLPNPKGKPGVGHPQQQLTGLYRSEDAGATWTRTATSDVRPFYYSQVRVDPRNPDRVYWSSTPINVSDDGGKTVRQTTVGVHVDHHAMWIDPNDPNRIVVGDDGGVSETFDRGGNWLVLNSIAISQLYDVSYDNAIPYNVCGGLQDNGAWCGPSRRKSGAITNSMWYTVNGGDGFYTAQDPTDPHTVYAESQGGDMARINVTTGESTTLAKPNARAQMAEMEDTIAVILDDSAHANTLAAKRRVADLRATIRQDSIDFALRWNWETPFFLSPHDPHVLYAGSNRVMKSTERGDHMYPISPDLTYADTMKIRVSTRTTGGITTDATGAETFPTIVSLAESYIRPGLLYAGTDDGRTWLTRNGGGSWEELTGRMPGVPAGTYVSRIEPSHFDTNTFYVSFDNHRTGDYTPYVYVTHDYGKTFQSMAHNLPTGGPDYVHVVREDPGFANVLFLGTETACYVSTNAGGTWQRFMSGLPTVPVYDLKIQPRDRELIAATHGRSIWIVDINALGQLAAAPTTALTVFKPKVAFQYGEPLFDGQSTGQGIEFRGQSPAYGADIEYYVAAAAPAGARVAIVNALGDTIRTIDGSGAAGLQRVTWDFRLTAPPAERVTSPAARRDSILRVERITSVFDSLKRAGKDTAALGRIHRQLAQDEANAAGGGRGARGGGGGGGGGGRGRGNADVWVERPGESAGRGGGGGGGGGGRGRGAGAELTATGADSALTETINGLIPPAAGRGGRGGGGGGFGGGNLTAAAGQYAVVVRVGDQVGKVLLNVERSSGEGNDRGIQADDSKTVQPIGEGGAVDHLSAVQWFKGLMDGSGTVTFGAPSAGVQAARSVLAKRQ
ncbi:MAG TPA: hypothetical protein VHW65_03760, partial [Gemmatimonadales bacterium]|nr:hypothetical protein [Gemmatimonadales bacterium]